MLDLPSNPYRSMTHNEEKLAVDVTSPYGKDRLKRYAIPAFMSMMGHIGVPAPQAHSLSAPVEQAAKAVGDQFSNRLRLLTGAAASDKRNRVLNLRRMAKTDPRLLTSAYGGSPHLTSPIAYPMKLSSLQDEAREFALSCFGLTGFV
jgi:hypothetical protein